MHPSQHGGVSTPLTLLCGIWQFSKVSFIPVLIFLCFAFILSSFGRDLYITLDYCTRGNGSFETGVKENVFVGGFGRQKIPDGIFHPSHLLLGSNMQVPSPPQAAFQTPCNVGVLAIAEGPLSASSHSPQKGF